jgi:hypothetical protein
MADAKITALLEKTDYLDDDDNLVITDSKAAPVTTKRVTKATALSSTYVSVLKATAGTIAVGKVVYLVGYDGTNETATVELADNSSPSTMPAYGIVVGEITDTVPGKIVIAGRATGISTGAFTVGQAVYTSTSGDLTATKPTGTAQIQKIGVVVKNDASLGVIEVGGAGRTNDLPNLPQNNIWIGNASAVPTATPFVSPAWIQYRNSTNQDSTSNSPTFTAVNWDTDDNSNLNSVFTKPSASQFQVSFTGQVEIIVNCSVQNISSNGRAPRITIRKNGATITGSQRQNLTETNANRYGSIHLHKIVSCVPTDTFSVGLANSEASGNTVRIPAGEGLFLIKRIS